MKPNGPAVRISKRCWAIGGRKVQSGYDCQGYRGRKERSTARFLPSGYNLVRKLA